jgi:hypothetical protein
MTYEEMIARTDEQLAEISPLEIAGVAMERELGGVDPKDAATFRKSPQFPQAMGAMQNSVNQELMICMVKAIWKSLPPDHMKRASAHYGREIRRFLEAMRTSNAGG